MLARYWSLDLLLSVRLVDCVGALDALDALLRPDQLAFHDRVGFDLEGLVRVQTYPPTLFCMRQFHDAQLPST